jgi:hypothetical protein
VDVGSRRFRSLELGVGPLDPETAAGGDTDVCRRCGAEHKDGELRCQHCNGVLGGPGQDAFDEAFHARKVAVAEHGTTQPQAAVSTSDAAADPLRRADELGFGGVLAAAALTACLFALISIPVRLVFAAASHDPIPGRSVFELLFVTGITLAIRRLFARELARL